ncbi:MAG: hypothetical protein R3F56_22140 [Planctomycetota bacterium]
MRLALTASCLALFAAQAPAQRSNLKRVLPPQTIAFFALPDLDTSIQELMDMPLMRMWRQQELQQFLAPGLAELSKQWDKGLQQAKSMHEQGALPFPPEDLLQLRLYGATFALTGFKMNVQGGQPVPDIGVLVHLDFGPSAPIWKKVLGFLLERLEAEAGDDLIKASMEAGSTEVTTWTAKDVPVGFGLAWVGDGIVLGTRTAEIGASLSALGGEKDILTGTASYKSVAANVANPKAEAEMFLNMEALYATVFDVLATAKENAPDFPPELDLEGLDRALTAFGIKSIKAMGVTSTYEGNKAVSKSYVLCPAPERKGLLADGSSDLDLSCLSWVPKKATACHASTLNVTALWDAVVSAIKAYDDNLAEGVLAQLEQTEQQIGFSVREDLCGAFGNQMVSWSLPIQGIPGMGGGSLINGMFLVQMKDKDRLLKCLKAIRDVSGGSVEFDSNTRDDLTTYYLKLNVDLPGNLPINPLDLMQPVFGFQSGYMVLGFSRSDVRKTINAMTAQTPEADTIRGNKQFAAMLADLSPERLTAVSFDDNGASFDNLYELAYGFSYMVPEDFPLDVQKLPDEGHFLSQHLFPSTGKSYTDGTGFLSTSTGPFGPEVAAILIGVGASAGISFATLMPRRAAIRRR